MPQAPIWVPLVVAVIGIAGILYTQYRSDKREERKQAHERKVKQMELEAAQQQRLRDERMKAYADLARLAFTYQSDRPYQSKNPADIKEVLGAYSVVEVLAGSTETRDAAKELFDRVRDVREAGNKTEWHTEGGKTYTDDPSHREASDAVYGAWKNFTDTAREELQGKA